jgi:gluconate 5-dehydrogenase
MEKLPGIKLFDLSGRSAIITGGSKGLGLAMAAGLASAGANVILVNRNAAEGADAAEELSKLYNRITILLCETHRLTFSADK